jgi:predicted dehydrogenase
VGRLRVAVLGTAHVHVPDHLAVLLADWRTEIVAVYQGKTRWWIPLPGVPEVPDPIDALELADVALIDSTTAEHDFLVPQVAAAGLPALVEKPLASTADATVALESVAHGAVVTTAMFLRCSPALRRTRALLAEGVCGDLVSAHARFSHPGLADGMFTGTSAWMLDPRHGAVGGFTDLGVHLLDLLAWLRPTSELVAVSARLRHDPDLPLDVGGVALLDWGGVPTTVHAGWKARPGGFHLHVEGTEGSLTVDGGTLTVRAEELNTTDTYGAPAAGDAVVAFLAAVRGERSLELPTPREIVATSRVLAQLADG